MAPSRRSTTESSFDHRTLTGLGKLAGLGDLVLADDDQVGKVGRTTGTTNGRVSAFELDNVVVEYDSGVLKFDGQVEIESADSSPFSQGGDSGSLIVDADRAPWPSYSPAATRAGPTTRA